MHRTITEPGHGRRREKEEMERGGGFGGLVVEQAEVETSPWVCSCFPSKRLSLLFLFLLYIYDCNKQNITTLPPPPITLIIYVCIVFQAPLLKYFHLIKNNEMLKSNLHSL